MWGSEAQASALHPDLLRTDDDGDAPIMSHAAVGDGHWLDAGTRAGDEVPGDGALVPTAVSVEYPEPSAAGVGVPRGGAGNDLRDGGEDGDRLTAMSGADRLLSGGDRLPDGFAQDSFLF